MAEGRRHESVATLAHCPRLSHRSGGLSARRRHDGGWPVMGDVDGRAGRGLRGEELADGRGGTYTNDTRSSVHASSCVGLPSSDCRSLPGVTRSDPIRSRSSLSVAFVHLRRSAMRLVPARLVTIRCGGRLSLHVCVATMLMMSRRSLLSSRRHSSSHDRSRPNRIESSACAIGAPLDGPSHWIEASISSRRIHACTIHAWRPRSVARRLQACMVQHRYRNEPEGGHSQLTRVES
jgi:hypothetical protein